MQCCACGLRREVGKAKNSSTLLAGEVQDRAVGTWKLPSDMCSFPQPGDESQTPEQSIEGSAED